MNIKTGRQLADACILLTKNYKTLYVLGCFGAPMTEQNKQRYINAQSYNRKPDRLTKINSASEDTFGFDCVGMIKGLLWDWKGILNSCYGGADYAANGIPDLSANGMIRACEPNVSTDFSNIQIGEVVWTQDHIGVYVGNGLAVECTPRWKDGCQVTAVLNMGLKSSNKSYNGRTWTRHGKLPYITYEKTPTITPVADYDLEDFVRDVQGVLGAVVDGEAGAQTLSKTITVSASYNRKHPVVKFIQRRLYTLGYTVVGTPDGVAGSNFSKAVFEYQKDNTKYADGVISAKKDTWKSLLGMISEDPDVPSDYSKTQFIKDIQRVTGSSVDGIFGDETLRNTVTVSRYKNNTHPCVKYIQKRLKALGYNSVGSADGVAGRNFDIAIKDFQRDNECYVDGEITAQKKTWKVLLTV